MKAFSFKTEKGTLQIGAELEDNFYNFSQAWEIYKQLKNQGRGPSLTFLQVMVEADFFSKETFEEVFSTLKEVRPLSDLKLSGDWTFQCPIDRPQKILCIGRNYRAHAEELGNEPPEEPIFFSKAPSSIIPHAQSIKIPPDIGRVDFEGELAIVIGKKGHRISEARAFEFIAGYSILNDVTARELQRKDIEAGKPWFRSKSFDTFCPVGPFLVTKDSVSNLANLRLVLSLNNEVRQEASLSHMIFGIEEIVAYVSKFCTLMPGDVIATGTPAGVAPMQSGDVVECTITGFGTLKNDVK